MIKNIFYSLFAQLTVVLALGVIPLCSSAEEAPPSASVDSSSALGAPLPTADVRVLLAPALETTLGSAMAGQIATISVGLGESFTAGKTLLKFDCAEQQARVEMATAELASAQSLHQSKQQLMAMKQAGKVEVAMAASAVNKAAAQVKLLEVQREYCSVKAPFAGRVVKLLVKTHQGVAAAQPLLEIVSSGALKLRINVPANWVSWLRVGAAFRVSIDETGKTYSARVTALNARIDAVSQTIEIEAAMTDKAPELLPGMSGTAHFTPPTEN